MVKKMSIVKNQNLFFSKRNLDLITKIIDYLETGKKIEFEKQELNKGLFIRCLIIALIKLQYIDAEQKAQQQENNERSERELLANIEESRKYHRLHIEEDNLILDKLELQKKLETGPEMEGEATTLDSKEIISLEKQFVNILENVKLIYAAQDKNQEDQSKPKLNKP